MKANTFRGKNGKLYINEITPYTGENGMERAMVYFFGEIKSSVNAVNFAICDDDDEERTVFDRMDILEKKLDVILNTLQPQQPGVS